MDRSRLAALRVYKLCGCHPATPGWTDLVGMGDEAVPPLARVLATGSPAERAWAAIAANRIASPAAWAALGRSLGDPEPTVALYAALASARLGDDRAFDPLARWASGEPAWRRWQAYAGLGHLSDPRGVPILRDAVRAADWNESNQARAAFGHLGARALPAVRALLASGTDPATRAAAVPVLARSGDLAELLALADDSDASVRMEVARSLAGFAGPTATRRLRSALSDPAPNVRWVACRGLGVRGDREAVEPLRRALGEPERSVRAEACQSLGRLGAVDALLPLLSSPELAEGACVALIRARSPLPPEARALVATRAGRKHLRRRLASAELESRRKA